MWGIAVVTLVFIVVCCRIFVSGGNVPGKLPPGPRGLPFIGSALSLDIKAYITLGEWVKIYGHIFRFKIAQYKFVIISDAKLAREAFNNPALLGRPDFRLFQIVAGASRHGIVNSSGKVWSEIRNFTVRTLRTFGFGKQTHEELALEEVQDVIEWMKASEGKAISMESAFDLPVINSFWAIMTGRRFRKDDPLMQDFLKKYREVFEKLTSQPLAVLFPNLCDKFPSLTGWKAVQDLMAGVEKFVSEPVENLKRSYCPEDPPHDFVEAVIHEIKNTTDPSSAFYKDTGAKNKRVLTIDLFNGSSTTESQTIAFSLFYLCKYPEIQVKLHQEIDSVVGQSRQPVLDDRKTMPYTEAFMYETLRKSSVVPLGLFHEATETTTVSGYTVPKGTWIAVNEHFIHHDPRVWGDPENFRPARFLGSDGKTFVKYDSFIPFSVGKRACIGEQVAKDTFFLFLTGIMQRFEIRFDPNSEEPSEGKTSPLIIFVPPFKVIVKERIASSIIASW